MDQGDDYLDEDYDQYPGNLCLIQFPGY
jgi:hypothetical protein